MLTWLGRLWGALFMWGRPSAPTPAVEAPAVPTEPQRGDPAWLTIARADLGIVEFPGAAANPRIMEAWKYCDYQPPAGDETSWCSAKMCEWMEKAGQPSTRAPNARSWLKWGVELAQPKPGAVSVFWRGSPTGWEGHVGFFVGAGDAPGSIKVLGANQKNQVCIEDLSTGQLLGYRWPTRGGNSRTLRAQATGGIGDALSLGALGLATSAPDLQALGTDVQSLANYWPWCLVIGIALSIVARLVTIHARVSDWKAKGT
jgi:uncharacterized protein (TIGR02594 family)